MVTASLAMMQCISWSVPESSPDVAAGLSLGEYPAMAAAGVMSDGGCHPHRAAERYPDAGAQSRWDQGAMAAVLAMDAEKIEEVIAPIEGVQIANYNCPGQIVISGKTGGGCRGRREIEGSGRKDAFFR